MKRYRCTWCAYVYDPAVGELRRETAPGTPFERLPDDWRCPDCRAPKADFRPIEDGGVPGVEPPLLPQI